LQLGIVTRISQSGKSYRAITGGGLIPFDADDGKNDDFSPSAGLSENL